MTKVNKDIKKCIDGLNKIETRLKACLPEDGYNLVVKSSLVALRAVLRNLQRLHAGESLK